MHRLKKMKLVSMLVVLVMAFGLIPFAAPQGASAAPDLASLLAGVVAQMQAVNYWLGKDTTGQAAVSNAHSAFGSLAVTVPSSLPLAGLYGTGKYYTDQASAEAAVAQLLKDLETEKYSQDMGTALTDLSTLYINDEGTVTHVLSGVSLEDLVNFETIAQGQGLQNALGSSSWQNVMKGNNVESTVASVVTSAMNYAGVQSSGSALATALTNIGWGFSGLASAEVQVDQEADSGYLGEAALIRAFVRSEATASTSTSTLPVSSEESFALTAGNSTQFKVDVFGNDATSSLTPVSSNTAVATFTEANGQFTLTGLSAGSAEITAYLSNQGTDWVYKANVTVTGAAASITPSVGGTVSLGTSLSVSIPAGALISGTSAVTVTIQQVSSAPSAPSGFMLLGYAYDVTVGGLEHYNFNKPITLTFSFDPSKILSGEAPAVYYYNGTTWVDIGGTVNWSNDTVTVTVTHFTTYAVMAAPLPVTVTVSAVSAVNGAITVTLSAAPATTPVTGDFAVTQSINGAAATTVTPTAIATSGATVTLTVPLVTAAAFAQSVVFSVSYQGGTPVAAIAFTVPATGGPATGGGGGAVSVMPAVTSVSPGTGSTAGGTTVTINGANFTGATAVKFGAVAATSFTVNSNGTITAISPAGAAGTVDVSVTTPNGASSVNPPADQFTYTVPAPTPVKGIVFTDVPNSFWAYGDIGNLSGLGYVSGYPDGTFKPNNQITRAEFCAIMDKALNLTTYTQQTPTLTDVSSGDWFYGSVESAVYAGIFKGYGGGTFQPNAPISRQEITCVLVQAMGKAGVAQAMMNAQTIFTDDASIAAWARGFVAEASQAGLIKGYTDGSFAPTTGATRAEACVMISNLLVLQSKS